MNKRQAYRIALAIIATEDVTSIVASQVDGANARLDGLSAADKQRIVDAADAISHELHIRAGEEALDFVVGSDANGSS